MLPVTMLLVRRIQAGGVGAAQRVETSAVSCSAAMPAKFVGAATAVLHAPRRTLWKATEESYPTQTGALHWRNWLCQRSRRFDESEVVMP